ncbi:KEOPS complex Pcc1-like subunit [Methanocaldococcus villosus KIN24-T80]|uniref:KEOPS complex Pcc1-like subunit n=1 Tax=Methanocaldococcus villosus KIN24-T80 TaxID=1069083 RepID=N6VZS4_9EURY|nr:KEOPS complex subunit Pcc1 [Methanocaldococcus villosus]ENN96577.1 KEOPS complex Pcc1-like subunit [Methanocaldococcus villosus KIN24-T80]
MNRFKLILTFDSEEEAKIIYNAIYLEHISSQIRSRAEMKLERNVIKIHVESPDISILKASIYSYLRWISAAQNIYRKVRECHSIE